MSRVLAGVAGPAPGSSFSQVDHLYPFERASDWHRSYLEAAFEHLLMWADTAAPLLFHPDQEVIHRLRPAYTLGRAALEASAHAVWLSGANSAEECARRHLSLVRWDYEERRKSAQDHDAKEQIRGMDRQLLARTSGRFSEDDLQRPGLLDVLRGAALVVEIDPADVERVWRAASGAAHGKRWPALELQRVVSLEEYEPGQDRVLRVPDTNGMTEVLRMAEKVTTYGAFRHADFCDADIPALGDC